METPEFYEKLEGRVKFLLTTIEGLEPLMTTFKEELANDETLKPKQRFDLFRQLFTFYNRSLELIRMLVSLYPIILSKEDKELLSVWNNLASAEKRKFLNVLKRANTP